VGVGGTGGGTVGGGEAVGRGTVGAAGGNVGGDGPPSGEGYVVGAAGCVVILADTTVSGGFWRGIASMGNAWWECAGGRVATFTLCEFLAGE